MRVTKILTTSVTAAALAFSMLASAIPANAANPGYHAAWVAQSAYASAAPGQTVQMSAVYQNTGDSPWIKGTAGQQANFGAGSTKDPAYPRDTTAYANAGWNSGQNWLSSNRFAAQANDLVATSQLGSWVWSVKVPAAQATGDVLFNGTPVVDGKTWMEDYGFFLKVTVTTGTVKIDSTAPASPSTTAQPVVNGSGAPAGGTVSIWDEAAQVGTGTADSAGKFSIATTALAEGTHTLSATATDTAGSSFASANSVTYTVDRTAATVSSVTAPGTKTIIVRFSEAMDSSSTSATGAANPANYALNNPPGALGGAGSISASADKTTYTLTLATAMNQPSGGTLTVKTSLIADAAGNKATSDTDVPFVVNDTTGPAISSVSATAPSGGTTTTVTVKWNEAVACSGAYNVDGITATAAVSSADTCTITSQALNAGSTHTLTATNEADTAGNSQSPNPSSRSFTVATGTATISIVSSSATGETSLQIVWSAELANPVTGVYTVRTPNNTTIADTAANDTTNTSAVDLTLLANPFATLGCNGASQTSCTLTVDVTAETGANGETQSAPILVTTATVTKDTTAPTLVRVDQSDSTQTQFDIVWSENVSAPAAVDVKIMSGTTIVASTNLTDIGAGAIALTVTDGTAADTKTHVAAASAIAGGPYTLTVAAALVTDQAGTANANAAGSIPMSVTDTTRPTVAGAAAGTDCQAGNPCKTFTFTYSEKMATSGSGSVIGISHYTLNGAAVSGTAAVDGAGTTVTITLTSNAPAGDNQFAVTGVTDAAGNLITPNPTLVNFTRVP